jgi:hypothetical protein
MRGAYLALVAAVAVSAEGQGTRAATVRVTSVGGQPVPFAVVSVEETPFRIAGADGALTLPLEARDSLRVMVRRIGYRPVNGWARRSGEREYAVAMTPIAASLDTVRVVAQMSTPLSKTGFYDRVERVRKSAMLGEFISPEELEARNLTRLSDILQGRQYSRIATVQYRGRTQPIAQGRGRCSMNIVVDGMFVKGTTQELNFSDVPLSIRAGGSSGRDSMMLGLDEIVDGRSIMGIEIYPSIAGAPVELIPTASRGGCGLVAIWTGPRK